MDLGSPCIWAPPAYPAAHVGYPVEPLQPVQDPGPPRSLAPSRLPCSGPSRLPCGSPSSLPSKVPPAPIQPTSATLPLAAPLPHGAPYPVAEVGPPVPLGPSRSPCCRPGAPSGLPCSGPRAPSRAKGQPMAPSRLPCSRRGQAASGPGPELPPPPILADAQPRRPIDSKATEPMDSKASHRAQAGRDQVPSAASGPHAGYPVTEPPRPAKAQGPS